MESRLNALAGARPQFHPGRRYARRLRLQKKHFVHEHVFSHGSQTQRARGRATISPGLEVPAEAWVSEEGLVHEHLFSSGGASFQRLQKKDFVHEHLSSFRTLPWRAALCSGQGSGSNAMAFVVIATIPMKRSEAERSGAKRSEAERSGPSGTFLFSKRQFEFELGFCKVEGGVGSAKPHLRGLSVGSDLSWRAFGPGLACTRTWVGVHSDLGWLGRGLASART